MENILDIRKEKQLNFILSTAYGNHSILDNEKSHICVVVCLYYIDNLDWYINYINRIPKEIQIYICSSKSEVLEKCREKLSVGNVIYCLKENRGRDISALLVAMRTEILKYDYFCFVHDKSPNQKHLIQDVEFWNRNLWENTLANENYIYKIIELFEANERLGLLSPPEPFGEYYSDYYDNTWHDDYENTVELAKKMKLNADIARDKEAFILGTVFWARTAALQKLMEVQWQYEDFPEEPLPIDGTISHAIEKILGYVAQDAGYYSGTIMTEDYAARLLLDSQDYMRKMFYQLQKREHVLNMHQINNLEEREAKIKNLFKEFPDIYIYGAGIYGVNMYRYLVEHGMSPKGFVVSNGHRKQDSVDGLSVWEVDELEKSDNTAILIAVSYEYREEVEKTLTEAGFCNFIYGY